jgi:hypothetical protein
MKPSVLLLLIALAPLGCASKKYVGREVGEVNEKMPSPTAPRTAAW